LGFAHSVCAASRGAWCRAGLVEELDGGDFPLVAERHVQHRGLRVGAPICPAPSRVGVWQDDRDAAVRDARSGVHHTVSARRLLPWRGVEVAQQDGFAAICLERDGIRRHAAEVHAAAGLIRKCAQQGSPSNRKSESAIEPPSRRRSQQPTACTRWASGSGLGDCQPAGDGRSLQPSASLTRSRPFTTRYHRGRSARLCLPWPPPQNIHGGGLRDAI
jgi:hypothetical protein